MKVRVKIKIPHNINYLFLGVLWNNFCIQLDVNLILAFMETLNLCKCVYTIVTILEWEHIMKVWTHSHHTRAFHTELKSKSILTAFLSFMSDHDVLITDICWKAEHWQVWKCVCSLFSDGAGGSDEQWQGEISYYPLNLFCLYWTTSFSCIHADKWHHHPFFSNCVVTKGKHKRANVYLWNSLMPTGFQLSGGRFFLSPLAYLLLTLCITTTVRSCMFLT